ncbi:MULTISPECIES: hypothetical protein [unclassified Sphingobacterium]|uniref:hypothetical protein n=1 Tax=unclassified Sphingobacterium TaxID=2609468 RepID=UPI001AE23038|nr:MULTISPECIES: hypothetical protein [unclassified Sphingobacterium]MDR6736483.1 hypothetical protein [Sphingobacterium sp. 2149]
MYPKTTRSPRQLIALCQLVLMSLIIISGVVFMHKEVKSTGEIVMHTHPYDFTKKQKPQETDDQIEYLNVIYHNTYVQTEFTVLELPIPREVRQVRYNSFCPEAITATIDHYHLRGPPSLV